MNLIFGREIFMFSKCIDFSQFRKMSEQQEEFDAQGVVDATEESDNAHEAINIPVTSEDLPESEDNELEPGPSGAGHVKEQNDQSSSSLPSTDEEQQLMEEAMPPEQVSDSLRHYEEHYLTEYDNVTLSANEYSNDMAFLEKIKAIKESLKTSVVDSSVTGIT